jgi:hypothetical protein
MEVRTVTVQLGDTEYTITEAPYKRASKWRRKLVEQVKPLFEQVAGASEMEFSTAADLLGLWPLVQALMVDGVDMIYALLIEYSDVLGDARENIENTATEAQIVAAFMEVVRLADPFGLTSQLSRNLGLRMMRTSTNSASPSGASDQTDSTN